MLNEEEDEKSMVALGTNIRYGPAVTYIRNSTSWPGHMDSGHDLRVYIKFTLGQGSSEVE